MALPRLLSDKLRLPAVGAPLFIISHPALVIAQCKAGIVGAFPALNARPISQLDEWLHEITEALAAHDRAHPDRPAAPFAVNQIVHKSNARLEEDMALTVKWKAPIVITSLGAREDVNAGGARLRRHHAARHHQQPLRPQGGGEGRGRADRGRRGRRRARGLDLAFRARPGHPRMVRRAASLVRRDRHRARDSRGAGDGRRSRLYRFGVHRDRGSARERSLQAGDRRRRRVRHRRLEPVHRYLRQLSSAVDRQGRHGSGQFAAKATPEQ